MEYPVDNYSIVLILARNVNTKLPDPFRSYLSVKEGNVEVYRIMLNEGNPSYKPMITELWVQDGHYHLKPEIGFLAKERSLRLLVEGNTFEVKKNEGGLGIADIRDLRTGSAEKFRFSFGDPSKRLRLGIIIDGGLPSFVISSKTDLEPIKP